MPSFTISLTDELYNYIKNKAEKSKDIKNKKGLSKAIANLIEQDKLKENS